MHHFLIPNSKFARYTIQISQIFRVKRKEKKKRKGRRREDFRSSFPSEIKKGEKYPLKINRSWSNSRGLKCLEEINFSFFPSSSFFLELFSSNFFGQVEKEGNGERFHLIRNLRARTKSCCIGREKNVSRTFIVRNSLLFFLLN